MMRSLSSATAGLRTHQTRMDVIGNNIANVNTYGFKSSRATFADVYYQNLSSGRSATGQTGGTNPTQIGYGSAVATIDVMQNVANASSTDRAMDVYIAGDGFLVSKDASGTFKYTRLGNLGFDADGNLVDANGNFVQGFPMNADGTPNINANGTVDGSALQGIHVDPAILDRLTGISITSSGGIIGMLPGDAKLSLSTATNPTWINSATTSLPATSNYRGDIRLAVSGYANSSEMNTAWGMLAAGNTVSKVEMGSLALPAGGYSLTVSNGTMTLSFPGQGNEDPITLTGKLDPKTGQVVLTKAGTSEVGLILTMDKSVTKLEDMTGKTVNLSLYSQVTTTDKGGNTVKLSTTAGDSEPKAFDPTTVGDKLVFGEFTIGFDKAEFPTPMEAFNGIIGRAEADEGELITLGNLVLAKFRNPGGLTQGGTSDFEASANSGEAEYVMPGLEGTGGLKAAYLEMSNVDLSKEFTEMITTQRGFQANSRIITVSDSMLEELVNLKR